MTAARSRDWCCRVCRRPWNHHIRPAPMVHDAVWAALGCEPDTLLCDGCFRVHMRHTLGRAPQLADLRVCPFNIEHWHHIELTRPGQQRQDFEAGVCASLRAEADAEVGS